MCACNSPKMSNCSGNMGCNCNQGTTKTIYDPLLPFERFAKPIMMDDDLKALGLAGSQWEMEHPGGQRRSNTTGDPVTPPATTDVKKPSFLDTIMGYVPVLAAAAGTVVAAEKAPAAPAAPAPEADTSDNTIYWLGGAVAFVFVGLLAWLGYKKFIKKSS